MGGHLERHRFTVRRRTLRDVIHSRLPSSGRLPAGFPEQSEQNTRSDQRFRQYQTPCLYPNGRPQFDLFQHAGSHSDISTCPPTGMIVKRSNPIRATIRLNRRCSCRFQSEFASQFGLRDPSIGQQQSPAGCGRMAAASSLPDSIIHTGQVSGFSPFRQRRHHQHLAGRNRTRLHPRRRAPVPAPRRGLPGEQHLVHHARASSG